MDWGLRDARRGTFCRFASLRGTKQSRAMQWFGYIISHKSKPFFDYEGGMKEFCWKKLQIRFAFFDFFVFLQRFLWRINAADIKKHEALCSSCVRKREKFAGKGV